MTALRSYEAALGYLAELAMFGMQPGIERLEAVLQRLGAPQARVPAVHIAGTNGKGSTAACCAALLLQAAQVEAAKAGAAPLRIGLYTSPHLLRVRERIQLSDDAGTALRECTEAEFCDALTRVRDAALGPPDVTLTFFEVLTAAALLIFAEAGVKVAVIETGLGGRLDATRLCAAQVTVVTSIGWDHMDVLGSSLTAIAKEKAGIFRPGIPAVIACADASARAVLLDEAQRVGAPVWLLHSGDAALPAGQAVRRVPPLGDELVRALPLVGEHQLANAALAVAAVQLLPGPLAPRLQDHAVLREGLGQTRWPGRLERIWPQPRSPALRERLQTLGAIEPDGLEIWLDAAHNPEGAAALARWLDADAQQIPARPLTVVFGVVAGKQLAGMEAPLAHAARLFLTRPRSPRGLPADELHAALRAAGLLPSTLPVTVIDDWEAALRTALSALPRGGRLLVFGSIFLLAAARGLLLDEPTDVLRVQDPLPARPKMP